jgi:hypothetical protein
MMSRASRPASPSDEIEAWRAAAGRTLGAGVLTRELADFCQSGLSVVVGTRGPDGWPVAGRAKGCRIDSEGRVRVFLRRAASAAILDAVAQGGGVAATFSRPSDHRTIQLKAGRGVLVEPGADDIAEAERQLALFRDELAGIGYPPAFTWPFTLVHPGDLAAVEFLPEAAFVQTPGPSAGSPLT